MLVSALAGAWLYRSGSAEGGGEEKEPVAGAPVPPAAATTAAAAPAPDLSALLADAVGDIDGHFSVGVLDPATGQSAVYGTGKFTTASIVKVDVLATLLWQRSGKLTAAQKADATLMIENSNNDATTRLWKIIGGDTGLAKANKAFGLTSTTPGTQGYWGLTTTTAADQIRLLHTVFTSDSALSDASRSYIQSLMGQIATDQDWGVSAADDTGDVHLKNGWLPRTTADRWVVNSIGRVVHDDRELLVSVLTNGSATMQEGVSLVEKTAEEATESFTTAMAPAASPGSAGTTASPATTTQQ